MTTDANPVRRGLTLLAVAAAGLLAACGQGSQSTTIVLSGPPDEVSALLHRPELAGRSSDMTIDKQEGHERATLRLPEGMPLNQLIDMGKAAAKAGVDFEYSSGSQWSSGSSSADGSAKPAPGGGQQKGPPARTEGPVV